MASQLPKFSQYFSQQQLMNIALIYDDYIDQDDIAAYLDIFFCHYTELEKIEHNIGADRESIRFDWQNMQFELNIECYSQSIWIEPVLATPSENLASLFLYLNKPKLS